MSQLKNPPDVGLAATALDVANLEAPKLAAWFLSDLSREPAILCMVELSGSEP